MVKITTIQLKVETRDKLMKHGYKGDTYDDILIKLMEYYDMMHKNKN